MAFIQCDFFSETLGLSTSMNVILPQVIGGRPGRGRHPVLWLLHGRSDDHTTWMRRSSIERYVAELGLAVVMPEANVSFYHNMADGAAYGTFIEEELPEVARSFFPLSDKREDNFIAGLSMGGYGAMRIALEHPDRFAAAASLSGALDVAAFGRDEDSVRVEWMRQVFGERFDQLEGSRADLSVLLASARSSGARLPELFACCGREDFLIEHSRKFAAQCGALKIPLNYIENEGSHEWGYWDRMIQEVLQWLPLPRECKNI